MDWVYPILKTKNGEMDLSDTSGKEQGPVC